MLGFEDNVRGFDMELVTDDNIDFLDIYAEFLGEEYFKMKENYQRAVATMSEILSVELERLNMSAPLEGEELNKRYSAGVLARAQAVHDTYIV